VLVVVVVVVGFIVGGVCGGNSTLGRGVFILVRGGIGGLGDKERLERSSPFNHSSKSSLNSCWNIVRISNKFEFSYLHTSSALKV
jgi:hypothetical protein